MREIQNNPKKIVWRLSKWKLIGLKYTAISNAQLKHIEIELGYFQTSSKTHDELSPLKGGAETATRLMLIFVDSLMGFCPGLICPLHRAPNDSGPTAALVEAVVDDDAVEVDRPVAGVADRVTSWFVVGAVTGRRCVLMTSVSRFPSRKA